MPSTGERLRAKLARWGSLWLQNYAKRVEDRRALNQLLYANHQQYLQWRRIRRGLIRGGFDPVEADNLAGLLQQKLQSSTTASSGSTSTTSMPGEITPEPSGPEIIRCPSAIRGPVTS